MLLAEGGEKRNEKTVYFANKLDKVWKKFTQYHFLSESHFQSVLKLLNLLDTDVNTSHTLKFSLYLGQGFSTKQEQASIW